jgi:hypothetical protein
VAELVNFDFFTVLKRFHLECVDKRIVDVSATRINVKPSLNQRGKLDATFRQWHYNSRWFADDEEQFFPGGLAESTNLFSSLSPPSEQPC